MTQVIVIPILCQSRNMHTSSIIKVWMLRETSKGRSPELRLLLANRRARMLFCLVDGRARTSTELAMAANVSPSTASAHLNRLKMERLVRVLIQGKHRYYSLEGPSVASTLEGLSVLAGGRRDRFVPNTPNRLRAARTCYDHMAGTLGVSMHHRLQALGWLSADYAVSQDGGKALAALVIYAVSGHGKPVEAAYACWVACGPRPAF